jgi:hypothetical protein
MIDMLLPARTDAKAFLMSNLISVPDSYSAVEQGAGLS